MSVILNVQNVQRRGQVAIYMHTPQVNTFTNQQYGFVVDDVVIEQSPTSIGGSLENNTTTTTTQGSIPIGITSFHLLS